MQQILWNDDFIKPLLSGQLIITPNVVRRPEYVESFAAIVKDPETHIHIDHLFYSFVETLAESEIGVEKDEAGLINAFSRWLFRRPYRSLGPKQLRWLHSSCTKLLKVIRDLVTRQGLTIVKTAIRYKRKGLYTARTITESFLEMIRIMIRTSQDLYKKVEFRIMDYGCKVKAVLEKHLVVIDITKLCDSRLLASIRERIPRFPTKDQSQRRLAVLIPIRVADVLSMSIAALSPILGQEIADLLDRTVEVLLQIDP